MAPPRSHSQPPALAPAPAAGHTALLIIDMISCWDFPDAEKLLPGAHFIAGRIAALKARCTRAGVPAIYVNDNRGRWRSDFPKLVELSLASGGAGAEITSTLLPEETDYFVLKPKQSAFFATPLELLLAYQGHAADRDRRGQRPVHLGHRGRRGHARPRGRRSARLRRLADERTQ